MEITEEQRFKLIEVMKKRIERRIEEYKRAAYILNEEGKC